MTRLSVSARFSGEPFLTAPSSSANSEVDDDIGGLLLLRESGGKYFGVFRRFMSNNYERKELIFYDRSSHFSSNYTLV